MKLYFNHMVEMIIPKPKNANKKQENKEKFASSTDGNKCEQVWVGEKL